MSEEMKRIDIRIMNRNTRSKGVIRDWDKEMTIDELAEAIDDNRGIISIERMRFKRYDKENKTANWTMGSNIIITMEGSKIPRELSLWGTSTRIKVRPFVERMKQCYNCGKYMEV